MAIQIVVGIVAVFLAPLEINHLTNGTTKVLVNNAYNKQMIYLYDLRLLAPLTIEPRYKEAEIYGYSNTHSQLKLLILISYTKIYISLLAQLQLVSDKTIREEHFYFIF